MRTWLLAIIIVSSISSAMAECRGDIAGRMTDRYVTYTDGTALDRYTGLMWMRCDMGRSWDPLSQQCDYRVQAEQLDWQQTLLTANSTFFAGHNDWRLPNVKELASLIERHCSPQIDTDVFLEAKAFYWSSTPLPYLLLNDDTQQFETGAWQVPFSVGTDIQAKLTSAKAFARLVRLP